MSIRPISTRTLDKNQFKKPVPPPVPNSSQCPTFLEQNGPNLPIYDTNIGEGGMLYEGRGKGYSILNRQNEVSQVGLNNNNNGEFSRQPVFNFTDRFGIDTRNSAKNANDNMEQNNYKQIQTTRQTNSMVGTYLRPQDSRITNQNYFNQNGESSINSRQFSGIGNYVGKGFVGNINAQKGYGNGDGNGVGNGIGNGVGNGRDNMLEKYSAMYKNLNGNSGK